jgi:hypothetical protein
MMVVIDEETDVETDVRTRCLSFGFGRFFLIYLPAMYRIWTPMAMEWHVISIYVA